LTRSLTHPAAVGQRADEHYIASRPSATKASPPQSLQLHLVDCRRRKVIGAIQFLFVIVVGRYLSRRSVKAA